MTIGCAAVSDTAVHGKTSNFHTEECRNRIGEHMDPEGRERFASSQTQTRRET